MTNPSIEEVRLAWKEGWREGMKDAAKMVEQSMIYANRENPMWAQRIIAEEIRRRAGEA